MANIKKIASNKTDFQEGNKNMSSLITPQTITHIIHIVHYTTNILNSWTTTSSQLLFTHLLLLFFSVCQSYFYFPCGVCGLVQWFWIIRSSDFYSHVFVNNIVRSLLDSSENNPYYSESHPLTTKFWITRV